MFKKIVAILIVLLLFAGQAGIVLAQEEEDVPREETLRLFCDEGSFEHPVLLALAERYGLEYEQVAKWFCEEDLGMGEIGFALLTAYLMEDEFTVDEIIAMRTADDLGWGEIWQELGLIANGPHYGENGSDNADLLGPEDNEGKGPPINPPGLFKKEEGQSPPFGPPDKEIPHFGPPTGDDESGPPFGPPAEITPPIVPPVGNGVPGPPFTPPGFGGGGNSEGHGPPKNPGSGSAPEQ